ncbi:MAG: hypothetical protein Q4G08_09600 [Capnocytophaga sp.]|nr:hypothetical protein [Capnocytophaga sp.]
MKKLLHIGIFIFAFAILFSSIRMGVYFSFYIFDNEDFVEQYCENKATPEMECNGKCKLGKIANNHSENDTKGFNFEDFRQEITFFIQQIPDFEFADFRYKKTVFSHSVLDEKNIGTAVFRPPIF